jgi:two-component system, OmpR family, sensor kinase
MNKITKRSFYSFLTLYLVSSFIFLSLASYWFFTAQLKTEMNANFHKMNNTSNIIISDVVYAHMMKKDFVLRTFPDATVALFDANKTLKYGKLLQEVDLSKDYYKENTTFSLISKTLAGHLGLEYTVIQNNQCAMNISKLKTSVLYTTIVVGLIIILIAVILSYIFLKPIRDKMHEIENFIKDTTHELNTPISALMMSTSRAKEKKIYDEKIITNISISAKQLYEIYSSLTFLNFDTASEKAQDLNFADVVHHSLDYFSELIEKKKITLELDIQSCPLHISHSKAKMLINNLLSNAIKYSAPRTKISIEVKKDYLRVVDEGIGIAQDKIDSIFTRFARASDYAGGFGIGLSIVDNIAKEYGYSIDIQSKEHHGTQVIINFRV